MLHGPYNIMPHVPYNIVRSHMMAINIPGFIHDGQG